MTPAGWARGETALLIGLYGAGAATFLWIVGACLFSLVSSPLRKRGPIDRRFSEGWISTILLIGLISANYYLVTRAVEFGAAVLVAAHAGRLLEYVPDVSNMSRSINLAFLFWFFGSGWVGKITPSPESVPWWAIGGLWLLLSGLLGACAAGIYLSASALSQPT